MDSTSNRTITRLASSASEILAKVTNINPIREQGNTMENASLLNNTNDEESMQYEWEVNRILTKQQKENAKISQNIILALITSFVIFATLLLSYTFIFDYLSIEDENKHYINRDDARFRFLDVDVTSHDISHLRNDLQIAFDASSPSKSLLATTVRLAFNDCSGPKSFANGTVDNTISICDGCIDDTNIQNNAGLHQFAIEPLEKIYYEGAYDLIMSRADYWAAAASIAIEYAAQLKYENEMKTVEKFADGIDLQMPISHDINSRLLLSDDLKLLDDNRDILPTLPLYFGRLDCHSSPFATSLNENNSKQFPLPNNGWKDTYNWFAKNFGFTVNETVAIIGGGHTLGSHIRYTEFAGNWVTKPYVFDNEYYQLILDKTQKWHQETTNIENRIQYVNKNGKLSMLNSDISLIYNIDPYLDVTTGNVDKSQCDVENSQCATQQLTHNIVEQYATNNQQFYNDFASVWDKMVTTGYNKNLLIRFSFH